MQTIVEITKKISSFYHVFYFEKCLVYVYTYTYTTQAKNSLSLSFIKLRCELHYLRMHNEVGVFVVSFLHGSQKPVLIVSVSIFSIFLFLFSIQYIEFSIDKQIVPVISICRTI